jgi:flagellar hook-associated protein 2
MPSVSSSVSTILPGLASGLNWTSLISALADAERSSETRWYNTQSQINQKNSTFSAIKSQLTTLQSDAKTLSDPTLFDSSTSSVANTAIASSSVVNGAAVGTYTFNITKLATAAQIQGTANAGSPLSATTNVSGFTLANAGFPTPVSAGTFTVDGNQVTVATSDTLQDVFNHIATATGNAVTAAYDPATDKITLSSSSEIVLGSATDSSNFLQVAQLTNNGTGTTTSNTALGGVVLGNALSKANFATPVSDGGSGSGQFTINGVAISYNASTDTVSGLLTRINESNAGVTASYDSLNDRFVLTNNNPGDVGIALKDVTGNFLAASGLSGGTLQHGSNLTYTVNGSSTIINQSNQINSTSSGITGLTVKALALGTTTVTVGSDTNKISAAIKSFISDYNAVQTTIDNASASTTNAAGVVAAGQLAGDTEAQDISASLRRVVDTIVGPPANAVKMLSDLGIQTNGNNNEISLNDATALTTGLTSNLSQVKALFTDPTRGVGILLTNYISHAIGTGGTLVNYQDNLTKQAADINDQVSNLERKISGDSAHWQSEFVAMESAQSKMNNQLTYLSKNFG